VQPIRTPSEEQVPSLGVIESVLEREDDSYRDRANGIDSKAGMILGAAGVIVALVGTTTSVTALLGQALAIAAGAAAAWVIVPRIEAAVASRDLRDRYLDAAAVHTRLMVLNLRILLQTRNEARLLTKTRRLRSASVLLLGSAVIILVSGILRTVG